jgi:very-short-patch-repair endonuclease
VLVRGNAPVHVAVSARRHPSGGHGLVVHRLSKYPPVVKLDGLPTVSLAGALVQSWQLLGPRAGRAPLIEAYRRRLVAGADLQQELDRATRLRARRAARDLLALLVAGCESELEIWGLRHVFDVPGLRHGARQRWVRVNGTNYRVDVAFDEERVAVELDGSAAHGSREQRERDVHRDAALASAGWLTIRFTYERLTSDPDGCRGDLLATLAGRRRRRDAE